jgi:hypothetical protein
MTELMIKTYFFHFSISNNFMLQVLLISNAFVIIRACTFINVHVYLTLFFIIKYFQNYYKNINESGGVFL